MRAKTFICLLLIFCIINDANARKRLYELDNNKSFAEQVTRRNTIYEVYYDFDLNNSIIKMPKGCSLRFNGGSITNGVINGNNTVIEGGENKLFGDNLILAGTWNAMRVLPDWFGAVGDGKTDDSKALRKLLDLKFPIDGGGKSFLVNGVFHIFSSIKNCTFICSESTKFYVEGENVEIDSCTFNACFHSVNRSLIECVGPQVSIKNCLVENIQSVNGKGAYGIFVNIERCSSLIWNCTFRNISDARETTDSIGAIKGMCGGVYYSGSSSVLTSVPRSQVLNDVELENIFTALPNGDINYASIDADGIRVFVNDSKTEKHLLYAQRYFFSNIRGKDIQKRLIKISGATNCEIFNVFYEGNQRLPEKYPSNLIAVYDAANVSIKNVINQSGYMDIGLVVNNSKDIRIDSLVFVGNGKSNKSSTANLFRVFNSDNIRAYNVVFNGIFEQLGRVHNSKNVYLQLDGRDFTTGKSLDIKNTNSLELNCSLRNVGVGRSPVMSFDNVKDVKINCKQDMVRSDVFVFGEYDNVDIEVNKKKYSIVK